MLKRSEEVEKRDRRYFETTKDKACFTVADLSHFFNKPIDAHQVINRLERYGLVTHTIDLRDKRRKVYTWSRNHPMIIRWTGDSNSVNTPLPPPPVEDPREVITKPHEVRIVDPPAPLTPEDRLFIRHVEEGEPPPTTAKKLYKARADLDYLRRCLDESEGRIATLLRIPARRIWGILQDYDERDREFILRMALDETPP